MDGDLRRPSVFFVEQGHKFGVDRPGIGIFERPQQPSHVLWEACAPKQPVEGDDQVLPRQIRRKAHELSHLVLPPPPNSAEG